MAATKTGKILASLKSWLRGKIYWLITDGPVGTICGTIMRGRACDTLGRVAVPEEAKAETVAAIIFGVYEYPERLLISRWLPNDLDCVELGCSIGVISRVILSKLNPACRLIAVEASEKLLDLTRKNLQTVGAFSRFTAIHRAVHYEGETVIFASQMDHIRGRIATSGHSNGTKTPCITLKQLIEGNSLQKFSLVMDIEGSEFDVVERDSDSLTGCQAIIAEVHGDQSAKKYFTRRILNCGFALAEVKHSVCAYVRRP
jgi:FkbM family methyltransferase